MERKVLDPTRIHPSIQERVANHHRDIVDEVEAAIDASHIVVVGMAQNPHCRRARKALDAAGLAHTYLEYGSYLGEWRRRNALKMWCGWPTLPIVFVGGVLVGGANELVAGIQNGTFTAG